jgi:hypothetical protein
VTSGSSARITKFSNVFSSKYAKGEPRSLGGTREQERLNYGADLLELISPRFSRGGLGDLLHARYESVLCVQAGLLVAHLGQDVLAVDAFIKLGRMSSFPLNVGITSKSQDLGSSSGMYGYLLEPVGLFASGEL